MGWPSTIPLPGRSLRRPVDSPLQSEHRYDQERLLEVLEGYKKRKAEIGWIALENCVMEQIAIDKWFRVVRNEWGCIVRNRWDLRDVF